MPIPTFAFDPVTGFNDTTVYTNPTSGSQARTQLQSLHEQTKTKVNEVITQVNTNTSAISGKANVNSPDFTGTPKAPTAPVGTNSRQIATTAFVQSGLNGRALTSEVLLKSKVTLSGTTLTIDLT